MAQGEIQWKYENFGISARNPANIIGSHFITTIIYQPSAGPGGGTRTHTSLKDNGF